MLDSLPIRFPTICLVVSKCVFAPLHSLPSGSAGTAEEMEEEEEDEEAELDAWRAASSSDVRPMSWANDTR